MSVSIVRGRQVVTRVVDRRHIDIRDDAAVLVEDGEVRAVDGFDALTAAHPHATVIGDGRHVVLPGFINAHHHIGLTPVQLGSPDMPLELWFVTRLVCRRVDLYLDTLYSAFEMIASGVTTVQHLHGWIPGGPAAVTDAAEEVIRAYRDIGMRASYSVGTRDQNFLVYGDNDAFLATLPEDLRTPLSQHFDRLRMTLDQEAEVFETLHGRWGNDERIRIQLAPANLHWCSDAALERLSDLSERHDIPMHMHLLETAYQRAYAERRCDGSAVDHLDRLGMLGPRLTLGHGVWLTEADVDKVAESGTHICHNCGSNFRLRSGIGALNAWEARGVNTALGIDEAGLNDDRDMLQEMRLALRAHRTPGHDEADVPTVPQILRMATSGGAATTPFAGRIGVLEPGRAADLVMIDADRVSWPYLDPAMPLIDAVVQRAKTDAVDLVMIAGETVYQEGRFTRVDRAAALQALHDDLQRALTDDEVVRRGLATALLPHVRKFYEGWIDPSTFDPFYRQNARL